MHLEIRQLFRFGSHCATKFVLCGSRFACWPVDLVCCCQGHFNQFFRLTTRWGDLSHKSHCSQGFVNTRQPKSIVCSFGFRNFITWWIVVLSFCRVGEAKVPGPSPTWTLAVCNPAGLNHKSHLFNGNLADIWLISETHLTTEGCRDFRAGLRRESKQPRWFVPGFPVQPRSTVSNHGNWSGVGVLSQFPCKSLPHDWSPWAFESSRLAAVTVFCHDIWLNGVVVYGLPTGPTHPQARSRTNSLLQEAVKRVLCLDGPRFLGGDFNHDASELSALETLTAHHFIEIQELFFQKTGVAPKPTCKHKTQRDFLYVSAELASLLVDVRVDHTHWVDHASVIATFQGSRQDVVRFPWPLPLPIPWDLLRLEDPGPEIDIEPCNGCNEAYQKLWHNVEQHASHLAQQQQVSLSARHFGRGVRRQPVKVVGTCKPMTGGRLGDPQPTFLGFSFLHRQWFRQLRRIQSYCRLAKVVDASPTHQEHQVSLWHAIRFASGFKPTFADWWTSRDLKDMEEPHIPDDPPTIEIATLIFHGLEAEVRAMEKHLKARNRGHNLDFNKHSISNLYRSVKRDAPEQVDILVSCQQAIVEHLDHNDCAVELDREISWDPKFPLMLHGREIVPIVTTPDKLYLDTLTDIQVGDSIVQNRSRGKLELVFEAFIEHWSSFWIKHSQVPASHWDTVLQFARRALVFTPAEPLDLSLSLLRATAKSKKHQAAVGLDGVSRKDILALSSNQLRALQSVYRHAHLTGEWPQQTLEGMVKSLAKVDHPTTVNEFRPITIFSFVYRLWSSAQSRYWLASLESCLDKLLCGNRAGYQAATLWRAVLEEVEWAQMTQGPLCGLLIDLSKAYNTLPRLPCLALALLAGVDNQVVVAWAGALGQLTRRFWIQGNLSPATPSDRGVPEGCGLSCLAMLLLNQIWHKWVEHSTFMAQPMSYVDNWEILCHDVSGLQRCMDATLDFAFRLDLHVDASKTSAWATDSHTRALLRQGGFRVIHSGKDLGAHLVYSRQIRKSSQIARFNDLNTFWSRLRRASGSFHDKVRIIRTAGWPRAMHGIAATLIGRKHFERLRTQVMFALNQNKPGANPMLLCCLVGQLDPQFFAIIDTFRQWRSVGSRSHQLALLQQTGSSCPEFAANSLTAVLVQRLHVLGWSFQHDGLVSRHQQLGSCDLALCNWQELIWSVERAWHNVVGSHIVSRVGFEAFHQVDVAQTREALQQYEPFSQGILRKLMIGSTVTNEHACYWSDTGSELCSQCGARDSLAHRFWHCESTTDLRQQLDPQVRDLVPVLPPVLTSHGWTLKSPLDEWWWSYLHNIPEMSLQPTVVPQLSVIDVFTDGSCFWPTCHQYRLASWAVCLAQPIDRGLHPDAAIVLGAGHLTGVVQTAFRAELMAVLMTLRWATRWDGCTRIWLDCQGVLDKFLLYTQGRHPISSTGRNSDLWMEVVDLAWQIGLSRIQLIKVEAHLETSEETPEVLRWASFYNDGVDKAAKQCNIDRGVEFWQTWERHAHFVHALAFVAKSVRDHQVSVMTRWSQEVDSKPPVVELEPRLGKLHSMVWSNVQKVRAVPRSVQKDLGDAFAERLVAWWNDVIDWSPEGQLQWISFSQLYLHFQLTQRHPGLIRVKRGWKDPSAVSLLIPEDVSFRTRCKWFRLYLQATWKTMGFEIGKALTRPRSVTLVCHVGCASVPVKQMAWQLVEEWLQNKSPPIRGHGEQMDRLPVAW